MPAKKTTEKNPDNTTGHDGDDDSLDDQVTRLREVLAIMSMTARTAALGAGKPSADPAAHSPAFSSPPVSSEAAEAPSSASAKARRVRR